MGRLSQLFLDHVGQTSDNPINLEIARAEGIYLYAPDGRRYIDLVSGVSVSNVGHHNPKVIDAVCRQANDYLHLMVYGELVQSPQVLYAQKLISFLPDSFQSVYFVNSGSEAVEGALKLAKRVTGRTRLISFKNAYHGSTHGALSMMGDEFFRNSFRPLLPDCYALRYNDFGDLRFIDTKTAAVIVEPVQGEAGFVLPKPGFLKALRQRCDETGALLIFDEIQTGFGRTGALFAFQKYDVVPDILVMAKAMGGGMPLGGFSSSRELMSAFKTDPVLGHITTFGGHPVSTAAGLAALEYIEEEGLMGKVEEKSRFFEAELSGIGFIREIRREGLLIALDFGTKERCLRVLKHAVTDGLLTENFLFREEAMRIAPPLVITLDQIREACAIIRGAIAKAEAEA